AAPVLAGEQPAGERTPDQDTEPLVEAGRNELVFRFARLQRVIDLLADEARLVPCIGYGHRIHDVPAGIVGAADIAHLAGTLQRIQRIDRLLDRRLAVPFMDLVEIDGLAPQTLQAFFARLDDVMPR